LYRSRFAVHDVGFLQFELQNLFCRRSRYPLAVGNGGVIDAITGGVRAFVGVAIVLTIVCTVV